MSFRNQIKPGRTYRCLTVLLTGPRKGRGCGFVKTPASLNVTCGHTRGSTTRPVVWMDQWTGEKIELVEVT